MITNYVIQQFHRNRNIAGIQSKFKNNTEPIPAAKFVFNQFHSRVKKIKKKIFQIFQKYFHNLRFQHVFLLETKKVKISVMTNGRPVNKRIFCHLPHRVIQLILHFMSIFLFVLGDSTARICSPQRRLRHVLAQHHHQEADLPGSGEGQQHRRRVPAGQHSDEIDERRRVPRPGEQSNVHDTAAPRLQRPEADLLGQHHEPCADLRSGRMRLHHRSRSQGVEHQQA